MRLYLPPLYMYDRPVRKIHLGCFQDVNEAQPIYQRCLGHDYREIVASPYGGQRPPGLPNPVS